MAAGHSQRIDPLGAWRRAQALRHDRFEKFKVGGGVLFATKILYFFSKLGKINSNTVPLHKKKTKIYS